MKALEPTKEMPELFQVLKIDLEGDDADEFCWIDGVNKPRHVMGLLEATEVQLRLTDLYGSRYKYTVVLYKERF